MALKSEISMWSSVMTTQRAAALGEIVEIVETCGVKTSNRQFGNIANDLKRYGCTYTLARLTREVEEHNEGVREDNATYAKIASLLARGKNARSKRYRINVSAARQYLQQENDDVGAAWQAFVGDGGLQ